MDKETNTTIPNISGLPLGLIIGKSMDRILDTGLRNGAAISHDILSQNWYASDFLCGPAQNCMAACAHFGPYPTQALARMQLDGDELDYLDSNGTVGITTWLVLP